MDGIERIKVLASEIKNKATLKVIEHLLSREDMNEKYLNEEKSLKQMISYIRGEAKKQAENGCAMLEDEEVYGLAIHYWDESNKDLKLANDEKKNISNENESKEKIPKQEKNKWVAEGQLSLFDVC